MFLDFFFIFFRNLTTPFLLLVVVVAGDDGDVAGATLTLINDDPIKMVFRRNTQRKRNRCFWYIYRYFEPSSSFQPRSQNIIPNAEWMDSAFFFCCCCCCCYYCCCWDVLRTSLKNMPHSPAVTFSVCRPACSLMDVLLVLKQRSDNNARPFFFKGNLSFLCLNYMTLNFVSQ